MKHKVLLYSLFLISLSAKAQKGYIIKYQGTERSSNMEFLSGKSESTKRLKLLSKQITKNTFTKAQKAEAIYLWICNNISYDYELRFSKSLQGAFYASKNKIIIEVLERRKALCSGYALLFEALCSEAGIETKTINGYTKLSASFSQPNHSWNAIKIKDRWQLLDITWSISHGSSKNPDRYWYCTNPEDFILSHYPENLQWSLLDNPPSLLEFSGDTP